MAEWIRMRDNPPTAEGEILFIAKHNYTDERIGIVWLDAKRVILRRTDLCFTDIEWWIPIPKPPTSEES